MAKIYVASSWKNDIQQRVVELLRDLGHQVYDFKNPPGKTGFDWSHVDPKWKSWTPEQFRSNLHHPIAVKGFRSDFGAMEESNICLLVLPCGRSAHTEAGYMKGQGKTVFVYQPTRQEPELMYRIYDGIITSEQQLKDTFKPIACNG